MMLIRLTLVVALLAFVLATAPAAEAQDVDFSGTWTLDLDASELPERLGRALFERGGATVVVTQSDTELRMRQEGGDGSRTVAYALDGRKSTNEPPRGTTITTSRWDGSVLVTEGDQELSTPAGNFTITLVERRTLSDEGQTMTIQTTRSTPRGDIEATLVFRRE